MFYGSEAWLFQRRTAVCMKSKAYNVRPIKSFTFSFILFNNQNKTLIMNLQLQSGQLISQFVKYDNFSYCAITKNKETISKCEHC